MHYASTSVEQRQGLKNEQIESRRAKDRAPYASMTRRGKQYVICQNALNKKPKKKQAMRDRDKVCHAQFSKGDQALVICVPRKSTHTTTE
jgi:phage FluMu gp28-like protein